MKKRTTFIGALVSFLSMGKKVLLGTLAVSTSTLLLSVSNANAGVWEDIESNMNRAWDSSAAAKPKDAIKYSTQALKLLSKQGEEENTFAFYMYSVRGWSKYEINDIRGACADWRKELSLSKKLGEETNVAELIRDEC